MKDWMIEWNKWNEYIYMDAWINKWMNEIKSMKEWMNKWIR